MASEICALRPQWCFMEGRRSWSLFVMRGYLDTVDSAQIFITINTILPQGLIVLGEER